MPKIIIKRPVAIHIERNYLTVYYNTFRVLTQKRKRWDIIVKTDKENYNFSFIGRVIKQTISQIDGEIIFEIFKVTGE